jgi:ATP-dependent DNA helicase PIF1
MDINEKKPLQLNDDFKHVLDRLESGGASMFITGRAGTGKSTLLQIFRKTTKKNVVVLAPTGVAALNVGGQTIHSFFGFPGRMITPDVADRQVYQKHLIRMYKGMDVLVIDEISMVRADLLDGIDIFLRRNRDASQPFGGVQVVFFGDLFQLPPVVKRDPVEMQRFTEYYTSPYFFAAHAMQKMDLELYELEQVFRQESRYFLRLLEAIRMGEMDEDDLNDLNLRHDPHFEKTEGYITLAARNATVEEINKRAMAELPGHEMLYTAHVKGSFDPTQYPIEDILSLREGAQVMFVKNDPERNFVNGTIGTIAELKIDTVIVQIEDGKGGYKDIETGRMDWNHIKYTADATEKISAETVGTFSQIPLKPAWAVTIHKSQGKTFDKVIIDLSGGAFEHGQLYVALSRCRTIEGVVLRKPVEYRDIITDERIVEFYQNIGR